MKGAAVVLVVLLGLAHHASASATAIAACQSTYVTAQGVATTREAKCQNIFVLERCLAAAAENPAEEAAADSFLLGVQAGQDCTGIEPDPVEPTVISDDGDMRFEVDANKDVVFARARREVVSIYDLNQQVATLTNLQASVSSAAAGLPDATSQLTAAALDAQTTLVTGLIQGQSSTLASYPNTASVSGMVATAIALENLGTMRNDIQSNKNQASGLASQLAVSSALVAAQQSTINSLRADVSTLVADQCDCEHGVATSVGQLDVDCKSSIYGSMRYNAELKSIEFCLDDKVGWVSEISAAQLGTEDNPAPSCAAILQADANSDSGVYFLKPEGSSVFRAYCDMRTHGGGFTLVAKVNNGDAKAFYGRGLASPFETGQTINGGNLLDPNERVDALGQAYRTVAGDEIMLIDGLTNHNLRGDFPGQLTMFDRMKSISVNTPVPNTGLDCAIHATNFAATGPIAGLAAEGFGLKCEDDEQTQWLCTDDGTFIVWAKVNGSHRNGLSKCGSDGGDDIYNGENNAFDGYVTVWVR